MELNTSDKDSVKLEQKLFQLTNDYMDVVRKSEKGYGYTYPSITEMLAKFKAGLKNLRLRLEIDYVPNTFTYETKTIGDGKKSETVVSGLRMYRYIDVDTGCYKEIGPEPYIGKQNDPSQALGSAYTYALRQHLTQYFQIATPNDDPDNWITKQRIAEENAKVKVAETINAQTNDLIQNYLDGVRREKGDEEYTKARSEIAEIVYKIAKVKNYMTIKNEKLASSVYEAISKKVNGGNANE